MKIGCLEKKLPMQLQKVSEGVYNIFAPGGLDIPFIVDLFKNPPEDAKCFVVFSEKGCREWGTFIDHIKKRYFPENKNQIIKYEDKDSGGIFYYISLVNMEN